jgi:hypothetical protein
MCHFPAVGGKMTVKNIHTEAYMKNKLAYLGLLGLLGFAGFFGTPLLFAFFGYFTFFQYVKVEPDELFRANVRVCATRGFFVFLISSFLLVALTVLMKDIDSLHSYAPQFAIGGFGLISSASLFIFLGSLMYLEAKEKRSKDDGEES